MRASYALPGIFPPVALDGRWLVDGALVNPVPVSAARVFGARLVIAVNLSADVLGRGMIMAGESVEPAAAPDQPPERRGLRALFGAEQALKRQFVGGVRRPGIPAVMVESFNIMQDRITRARLAGDPPDVLITPRVGQSAGSTSTAPRRPSTSARAQRSARWRTSATPGRARAATGCGAAGRDVKAWRAHRRRDATERDAFRRTAEPRPARHAVWI